MVDIAQRGRYSGYLHRLPKVVPQMNKYFLLASILLEFVSPPFWNLCLAPTLLVAPLGLQIQEGWGHKFKKGGGTNSRRVGTQIQEGWEHKFKKGGGTNSRRVGAQIQEGWGHKFKKGGGTNSRRVGAQIQEGWGHKFKKGGGTNYRRVGVQIWEHLY